MDEILNEASLLIGNDTVICKPCMSLSHGDICAGRWPKSVEVDSGGGTFTTAKINPQGQLCLSLNRPHTFHRCIKEILTKANSPCDNIAHDQTQIITDHEQVMTGSPHHHRRQPSVSDGRIILVKQLVSQILSQNGHKTRNRLGSCCEVREPESKSVNLVEQLLHSSFSDSHSTTPPSSLQPSPQTSKSEDGGDAEFLGRIESSPYAFHSKPHPPHTLFCDGEKFLREEGWQVYDKNIAMIKVRLEDGAMSEAASIASRICQFYSQQVEQEPSQVEMIHVASQSESYRLQQAMLLAGVCLDSHTHRPPSQHLILCSGVEVVEDGVSVKDYPLANLLQKRRGQMTAAFCVKHGDIEQDSEIQSMVTATTEAVVKFELLSTDPQSKVKLTVPGLSDNPGSDDVRFAGSFVLYNYARLATLVMSFEKACREGTYPPLPDMSLIDFSLLNDEEEWHILFHYLLQYRTLAREVCRSVCGSHETVRLCTKLKKVCQFLTQLSHSVSTYYRRVKILLSPEPHLVPLVHARLLLVMAIKQTMFRALQLLSIQPPQHL